MSQQKIVFAVCVFGALVALVYCQGSFDMNKCSAESQKLINQYVRDFGKMMQETSQSVSSQTGQNLNMDGMNADLTDLANSYMSFTNLDNGFDPQQIMTESTNIMRKQLSMVMKYLNVDMSMGSMMEIASLNTKIVTSNVQLMRALARACVPRGGN